MKTATFRPVILALSASALITAMVSSVSADEIILHEAVDDYTPVSQYNFNNPPQSMETGYRTTNILEESYHDYDGAEAIAFNKNLDALEQTEIAAFEIGGTVREGS
ncbi:MAG: hypothetical protein U9R74_18140, partial [Pseudomonadota bacterium]|nr:hypothetical protein [Pseudomonadota bacterium]